MSTKDNPICTRLYRLHIALAEGILVLSYHHGAAVAPEVKGQRIAIFNQIVFHSDVPVGVGLVGDNKIQFH